MHSLSNAREVEAGGEVAADAVLRFRRC
jgi:hypothetical protein